MVKQKKINVLVVTWGGASNFGTVLQGFALVTKLCQLGYHVNFYSKYSHNKITFKKIVKDLLALCGFSRFKNDAAWKYKLVEKFRKTYHHEVFLRNPIKRRVFLKKIDVFVTGSDQIWNTYFRYDPFFFLDFAGNSKRIAYSSSIGTNSVKEEYKEKVKGHLMKFQHIGVRESEAVKVLSELTKRTDITHVLDPVYLLEAKEWQKYIELAPYAHKKLPKKYIMCYFVGNQEYYHKQLEEVKEKYGINEVINVTSHYKPRFIHPGSILYNESHPFDFLYFIKNAAVVCTDSFHAMSLSLILSSDFVLLKRFSEKDKESQSSRTQEILNKFNVQYKQYSANNNWSAPIDYNKVQIKLSQERLKSISFLKESVEN